VVVPQPEQSSCRKVLAGDRDYTVPVMVVHKKFERQPHLPCSINLEEYPEARVNAWSIGELHVIDPRIVPNDPIFQRWILAPRVLDPYPFERFIATHPRWEPYA
jgi:hypothetical protein